MKAITKTYQAKIEAFNDALNGARVNLLDAGKILCEMLDENEDTFEILLREIRGVRLSMLEALERVGRGELEPLLLTDISYAAQRAVSNYLPKEDQKKLVSGTVKVVVENDNNYEVVEKRLDEMHVRDAKLAIGPGALRTPEEQIEILEEQKKLEKKVRYRILGDKIRFYATTELTWSELTDICMKLKPKAGDIESAIKKGQIVD